MRKPEKNRAVLGHVMFWAAILCREPDLVRPAELFRVLRPQPLNLTPSIKDDAWVRIAKPIDKTELELDMGVAL